MGSKKCTPNEHEKRQTLARAGPQSLKQEMPLLKGQAYAETPALPGIKRLYEHDYIPIKDDDRTVIGVVCAVRDVTIRWMTRDIERIKNLIQRLEAWELAGPAEEEDVGSLEKQLKKARNLPRIERRR